MRVVLCHECDVLLTYSSLLHLGHNVLQNVGIPVTPVLHLCRGGGGGQNVNIPVTPVLNHLCRGGAKCGHTRDPRTSPV